MHLSCPGSIQTKNANDNVNNKPTESELSSIVNETFRKAGRKRRFVGACQACQISKIRCERGRPCLRCEGRGISCVYFGEGRGGGVISGGDSARNQIEDDRIEKDISSRSEGEWPGSRHNSTKAKTPFNAQIGRSLVTLEPLKTSPEQQGYNWQRVRELCEIYFTQVHPLRCLSFIHKPSFMQALDAGRIMEDFGEALVYIICAFGERYVSSRSG